MLIPFLREKIFFKTYGKKLALTFCGIGLLGFCVLQLAKVITGTKSGQNQEGLFYYVAHIGRFQFREEPTDFRFWDNDNRADSKDYQNWGKSGGELATVMQTTHKSSNQVYKEFLINDAVQHPFLFTRQFFVKCFYGHVYFINSVQPKDFHLGPIRGTTGYWLFMLLINCVNLLLIFGAFVFLFKEKKPNKVLAVLGQ